jgi:peptidoglycan/LPS O-acetylase OafA/YrhL
LVVAWFRRRWDHQGPLVQRAGRGSYGAYVLHPPVLVALSLLARPLAGQEHIRAPSDDVHPAHPLVEATVE